MIHEPFETGPKHHLWFPAKWYKTELEKAFRNLPCCVVPLSPQLHSLVHACMDGAPPQKPDVTYMAKAISRFRSGTCRCQHHQPPHQPPSLQERRRDA